MVLLSTLVTAGTLVVSASAASADPTGCTTVNGGNFAESFCTGGTGSHRVVMRQRHFDPSVGEIACAGPFVPVGLTSQTACGFQQVVSVTVETLPSTGGPPSGDGMGQGVPMPVPPMIRVPKPPGMITPVPVDCFRQKFEDLIVRSRDNARAYVFVLEVVTCLNRSANFVDIARFSGGFREFLPLLPEILVLEDKNGKDGKATRISSRAFDLSDEVEFQACRDRATRSGCQTFVHRFVGVATASMGASAHFEFNLLV